MTDRFSWFGARADREQPGQDIEMGDHVSREAQPSNPRRPYPRIDFTPVIGDDSSDIDLGKGSLPSSPGYL